ncbi:MAG: thioredoxin family protein [Planctomycetota bacterium]
MNDFKNYYDIREAFWREHFQQALEFDSFLAKTEPLFAQRWKDMADTFPPLSLEQRERLSGHNRKLNILVYCSAWCGDCAQLVPLIHKIAGAVDGEVEMRLMERDVSEKLKDELRILGAMRVPIVVFLSEDFHEVARMGDRSLTAYRRKAQTETGAACSLGTLASPAADLESEQAEWVDHIERVLLMLRLAPPLRMRYRD